MTLGFFGLFLILKKLTYNLPTNSKHYTLNQTLFGLETFRLPTSLLHYSFFGQKIHGYKGRFRLLLSVQIKLNLLIYNLLMIESSLVENHRIHKEALC